MTTVLLASPALLGGCLLSQDKSTRISGAYVQPSDLSRVKIDKSTQDDVLNILSEPTMRKEHQDGSETWTWNWTKTEQGSGSLFLIFAGSSEKHVEESAHITFLHGIATDKWRD
tara:strand:+ start:75543 stop:75884 length:342 start_codon:yes stop_codon:yes gene_type:complete